MVGGLLAEREIRCRIRLPPPFRDASRVSITPYKRTPVARPVALMLESGRCRCEDGRIRKLFDVDERTTIYADNNTALRRLHRGFGRMFFFNDRPVRYVRSEERV